MRILLVTGTQTEAIVREAAEESGHDCDVAVIGEVASFISPERLTELIKKDRYDFVIVSGMCTADFSAVEKETGVFVLLGPRHAADLGMILPAVGQIQLSRTTPADDLIAVMKRDRALDTLKEIEEAAEPDFFVRGIKIGGGSRMKVVAEIMDAHRHPDIRTAVLRFFSSGADIVDLGFGFDAIPEDVAATFSLLEGIDGPLAADTQDPELIRAALVRADLILSLQEENIPLIGTDIARAGVAAVVVPGEAGLAANISAAEASGIEGIIADPLLPPAGSGLVRALAHMAETETSYPLFFGAGNVVELIDADSPGANALLAAMAQEIGAALIFTSEHSDKTLGSVAEMRRATMMMALMKGRTYPKDLGLHLFVIKEKRRRQEPPVLYKTLHEAGASEKTLTYDPCGNFRIGIDGKEIIAERMGVAIKSHDWRQIFSIIEERGWVSLLGHAAYLGKELYKAELAIRFNRSFEQDGEF
ncbi:MAG: Dihydropteroate synthase-related protein synthase-related protein [Methanomicrobiales archaeon 53_19]|uniref:dihydropteroate synthase-like protein n=1 Tax=Methanocalculus sp. TaxID=2004547 RepID=UPI000746124D|nr:dihydropteroate synthase-like protein [Methanocalculus sp.]KUK70695.1 MAG: Dihydropteroate synthase-related protein synthase-related protein [Methanocalculus sp. 52_23]KUL02771.1 MAG: Dihydropteroate synthase-related protein synthase-related protein [Methanomicrobiales archaeon 53_19]HIJ06686.1 dihydropteroate synthase-like protein [Methanocalculus sp.]